MGVTVDDKDWSGLRRGRLGEDDCAVALAFVSDDGFEPMDGLVVCSSADDAEGAVAAEAAIVVASADIGGDGEVHKG